MNCDYIFELKDKNKILSKFSRNVELLIDIHKRVFVCCSGKVLSDNKCKRHIGKESTVDKRGLDIVRDISEIQGDIKCKIGYIYVSNILKSKAEKILNILNKPVVILPEVNHIEERVEHIQDIVSRREREVIPEFNLMSNSIDLDKESNYESDNVIEESNEESNEESSDSEVELEVIKCDDGEEILINDKLEIIEISSDGYGEVVGKLKLVEKESKNRKSSRKIITYLGKKYEVC